MGTLLASVVPLALGAAISPTLFALEVLVLSGPRRPVARAWAVALGSALTLALYTLLGVTVLARLDTKHPKHSTTGAVVDLTAAALLALLAARALHRRRTAAESHGDRTKGRLAAAPTAFFVGAGALAMLVNFSTLVLFLPALHEIARAGVGLADQVLAWVVLVVITLLPVLLPVTAVTISGRRAAPVLARLNGFVSRHARQITAAIEVLFAVVLLWKGIGDLR